MFFSLPFVSLGGLGKLRKNVINVIEIARSNHEKLKCNDYYMRKILSMLLEVKEDMQQYTYHMKMDTSDVSEFFPLKDECSIKQFMDRNHTDWDTRKHGFYHLLYTTITKKKTQFARALLHTVFTRSFISAHRWPQPG